MPKKILVVDDDPTIVSYLVHLFTDNGYETVSARDGSEALEALQAGKVDLITLDLDMPNMYGTKFYRHLRKEEEHGQVPVIVISGITKADHAIKKAVATLMKPFDRDELMEIVRKTIG